MIKFKLLAIIALASILPEKIWAQTASYIIPIQTEDRAVQEAAKFKLEDLILNTPLNSTRALSFSYTIPLPLTGDRQQLKVLAGAVFPGDIVFELPSFPVRATIVAGPCLLPSEKPHGNTVRPCSQPNQEDPSSFIGIGSGRCFWVKGQSGQLSLQCKMVYSTIDEIISPTIRDKYLDKSYLNQPTARKAINVVVETFGHDPIGILTIPLKGDLRKWPH